MNKTIYGKLHCKSHFLNNNKMVQETWSKCIHSREYFQNFTQNFVGHEIRSIDQRTFRRIILTVFKPFRTFHFILSGFKFI